MVSTYRQFSRLSAGSDLSPELKKAVVAIGNFDGIHRGHQAILALARDIASSENRAMLAMTFEPHPRSYFSPDIPVFRLTSEQQKSTMFEILGLNGMLVVPFNAKLAATPANKFVSEILLDYLDVGHVVTGYDFHFGKGRKGTPAYLQDAGEKHGFAVTTMPSFDQGGEPVSSSRVRTALADTRPDIAANLLGYRWNATGEVQMGKQIGRTLGFPTANLDMPDECNLALGIYAVRLRCQNGMLYNGVASFGRRPTFDNGNRVLETFIFDFDDEIYGEPVTVSLFNYIRAEVKFETVAALVEQMKLDATNARRLLKKTRPLTALDEALNFSNPVDPHGK